MKKLILLFLFLFSGNELMGMDNDLHFLCNEAEECCVCLESVIQIGDRSPKGSVFALQCCCTEGKLEKEEVTIICNLCLNALKTFDRKPTFFENAATIDTGGFKPNYCCPVCRKSLSVFPPVKLTEDNIVVGVKPNATIAQPAVNNSNRLPIFKLLVLKHNKEGDLEAQKENVLAQFPMFNHSDIDLIVNGNAAFRNSTTLAFIVAGTAGGYGLYLVSRMIFKAEGIDQLEKSALSAQDSLLSLNFDLSNPIPSLSKQYDIPAVLKTIQDEPLRQQLEQAVSEFDAALEKTSSTIVSRYYYQTAEHFLEKEQELVAQLASSQAQLQALIVECKKQRQSATIGLLKISCATSIAAACGYYWAKASPLKKWGLF